MTSPIQKRLIRTLIFSALALIIGGGVAWWQIKGQDARVMRQTSRPAENAPKPMAGLKIGGPYTLVNHRGEKVTEKTYEGSYKLIYFGFTYCPAICPTELQKIRQAMKGLPEGLAKTVQPLFITIDPERDTVDVMKDYVSLFHPRLEGLTGTVPQIEQITKHYRIFAARVEDEQNSDYTMDHSSFTYLMGPNDELISMYRVKDTADFMAKDIAAKINLPE